MSDSGSRPKFVSDLLPATTETFSVGSGDRAWLQAVLKGRNLVEDNLGRLTLSGKIPATDPVFPSMSYPFIEFYSESPIGTATERYTMQNVGGVFYLIGMSADGAQRKFITFDFSGNLFRFDSDVAPDIDDIFSLGLPDKRWKNFDISGVGTIPTLKTNQINEATLNAGVKIGNALLPATDGLFLGETTTPRRWDGSKLVNVVSAKSANQTSALTTIQTGVWLDVPGCSISLPAGTFLVEGQFSYYKANLASTQYDIRIMIAKSDNTNLGSQIYQQSTSPGSYGVMEGKAFIFVSVTLTETTTIKVRCCSAFISWDTIEKGNIAAWRL